MRRDGIAGSSMGITVLIVDDSKLARVVAGKTIATLRLGAAGT